LGVFVLLQNSSKYADLHQKNSRPLLLWRQKKTIGSGLIYTGADWKRFLTRAADPSPAFAAFIALEQ
jgi:hypothetical protein